MIVDVHTHLWQDVDQLGKQLAAQLRRRFGGQGEQLLATTDAHTAAMQVVDASIVLGYRSRYAEAEELDALIASYVSSQSGRAVGFAGIDPLDRGAVRQLDELAAMHFSGVVISPAEQDCHPAHTQAMAVYEKCQDLAMPVMVHHGMHLSPAAKLEYARPALFDEVASTFPELTLILTNAGHPWPDETLTMIAKHAGLYTELGGLIGQPWTLYNFLARAHQADATDRVLFGSDFPLHTPQDAATAIYSINRFAQGTGLPSVPRQKLSRIVERDTLATLGLAPPRNESANDNDQTGGDTSSSDAQAAETEEQRV